MNGHEYKTRQQDEAQSLLDECKCFERKNKTRLETVVFTLPNGERATMQTTDKARCVKRGLAMGWRMTSN